MSEVKRVVEQLEVSNVDAEILDDLVHDVASKIASGVNNGGLDSQVEFLLENGITSAEIIKEAV